MLFKHQILCKIVIPYGKLFMKHGQHPISQQRLVCRLQVVATCNATLATTGQMVTVSLNGPIGH